MPESVNVLGVNVSAVTKEEVQESIASAIVAGAKEYYVYANIHAVNLAQDDEEFRVFLNNARLVYSDGEGVRVGARVLGRSLPPRIVMTDWIWGLSDFCAQRGYSVFLLGGAQAALNGAEANLTARFPELNIVGTHHGYFSKSGAESEAVVQLVNSLRPDILFVCFGMPAQEHWVRNNFDHLAAHVILFGGSTIDYAAGRKKVAPRWMRSAGFEWLYRLLQEPRRLWKRYLIGNPLFLGRVLLQRFRDRKVDS
ncbi:MAG: WecB/TagA/CpsF family glycosyltransferase [Bacteroidota bacterium]